MSGSLVFRGWARSILHLLPPAMSTSFGLPAEGVGSGPQSPKGLLTSTDILLCDVGFINKGLMLLISWLMVICYLYHEQGHKWAFPLSWSIGPEVTEYCGA